MSAIRPYATLQVSPYRPARGGVTAPEISYGETMREANAVPGCTHDGTRYDKALTCVYLEPTATPVSETLEDWTAASGHVFKRVRSATSEAYAIAHTAWVAGHEDEEWEAHRGTGAATAEGGGLWIWLWRGAPRPAATRDAAHVYASVTLGGTEKGTYGVLWAYGSAPVLRRWDGAAWATVGELPMGDGGAVQTGDAQGIYIQVLAVNGQTAWRCGPSNALGEASLVTPGAVQSYPLTVRGRNCHASFGAFPLTFPASGVFTSSPRENVWYNTSTPVVTAAGTGTIEAAPVTDGGAWVSQYTVTLTSSGGATPCVRSVRVHVPSVQDAPTAGSWTAVTGLTGYSLTETYSPVETSVQTSGAVYLDNHFGDFKLPEGVYAAKITAGATADGAPLWEELRAFGILGIEQDRGEEDAWYSFEDFSTILRSKPLINPPYFDGDCIYHSLRQLAEYGGVHQDWMWAATTHGAPSDSWTCDGVTCNPAAGHLRLGVGTGFQPLWRMPQGTSVWDAMQEIRRRYGLAVGFTPDGYFTAYPWQPWTARAAWSPAQTFTLTPAAGGLGALTTMMPGIRMRSSLRDVRNSLTLLGVDQATWEPIVSHAYDAASAFGDPAGTPPVNYLGYTAGAVESSSVYADAGEMEYIKWRLFNILRQPRLTVYNLRCLGQPLHALDYVGIGPSRVLSGGDKFFISKMQEDCVLNSITPSHTLALECDLVPVDTYNVSPYGWNDSSHLGYPVPYAQVDQSAPGDILPYSE